MVEQMTNLSGQLMLEQAAEIASLKVQLETERLRLAACGVAALGYFDGCKDEYRSASLEDTLKLYAQNQELKAQLAECKKAQMSVWILTCEYNDYDQHGEYFEAVFKEKPTWQQIAAHGVEQKYLRHVLNGGGRKKYEDRWFNLKEIIL